MLVLEDITSRGGKRLKQRLLQPGELNLEVFLNLEKVALLLLKFGLLVLNDKAKQLTLEARAGDREIHL